MQKSEQMSESPGLDQFMPCLRSQLLVYPTKTLHCPSLASMTNNTYFFAIFEYVWSGDLLVTKRSNSGVNVVFFPTEEPEETIDIKY